jgi:hypothetical protein
MSSSNRAHADTASSADNASQQTQVSAEAKVQEWQEWFLARHREFLIEDPRTAQASARKALMTALLGSGVQGTYPQFQEYFYGIIHGDPNSRDRAINIELATAWNQKYNV